AELPATLTVTARGRQLTANVAGVRHGPVHADDRHGGLAFVLHGAGEAKVHGLAVTRRPEPQALLPIGWGVVLGAVLGLAVAARARARAVPILVAATVLVAVAWLAGRLLVEHLLPQSEPEVAAVVLLALSGAPLAVASA